MDTELKRTASEETWKQLATRLDVELAALKAVAGKMDGRVAIVSGRTIAEIDRILVQE